MLSLTAYFLVFLDPKADRSDLQNVLMFERGIEFFAYIMYHLFWRGKSEINFYYHTTPQVLKLLCYK